MKLPLLSRIARLWPVLSALPLLAAGATSRLPGIGAAMQAAVDAHDVSGTVTVVATRDAVVHCEATGLADIEARTPMHPDTLFWVASMTKPIAGVAVLMLRDEGKLDVTDPVAKHLPEFGGLKTPSGRPANPTIAQIMTHTSGLGEIDREAAAKAGTLADLIPLYLAVPMQDEPGTRWRYSQSGINTAARIVEIAGGQSCDTFLKQRRFDPLGMTNTTFYPSMKRSVHRAVAYIKNRATGALEAAPRAHLRFFDVALGVAQIFNLP